jgi:hypothetical protein
MMSSLRIHVSRYGRADLLNSLTEERISYVERCPPPGVIVATSEWIELAGPPGKAALAAIAGALAVWLKGHASRRVNITLKDGKPHQFDARGYSTEEVGKLLEHAQWAAAIQTAPDEKRQG